MHVKKYPELIDKYENYKEQINEQFLNGATCLFVACNNCGKITNENIILKLLDLGANINYNKNMFSAINIACSSNNLELFKLLVNKGFDLHNKDYEIPNGGSFIFLHACLYGSKKMIDYIVSLNLADHLDNIIMQYIHFYKTRKFTELSATKIIKIIKNIEPDIFKNLIAKLDLTPLIFLFDDLRYDSSKCYLSKQEYMNGIKDLTKSFIANGVDPDYCCYWNTTALSTLCDGYNGIDEDYIELFLILLDSDLKMNSDNLNKLLKLNNQQIDDYLFGKYIYDHKIVMQILSNKSNDKIKDWIYMAHCNEQINKHIIKHRNEIYLRPNNIVSLCSEIHFTKNLLEIANKIICLFDINKYNKTNLINKINYYLYD